MATISKALNCVSGIEEDIRGHIYLLVIHDSLLSSAVTDVEFCRGNRVANLWNSVLYSLFWNLVAAVFVYLAFRII